MRGSVPRAASCLVRRSGLCHLSEIEAEQALVAANRKLITCFERKIQATLARVWDEDESALAGVASDSG
jgi:hypothetical protein